MAYRDDVIAGIERLLANMSPPSLIFLRAELLGDEEILELASRAREWGHRFRWGEEDQFESVFFDSLEAACYRAVQRNYD